MHHDDRNDNDDLAQYFRSPAAQEVEYPALYAMVSIRRIVGRPLTGAEYAELHNVLGLLS